MNYLLLESGDLFLLEDDSGSILKQNQPGSSSLTFQSYSNLGLLFYIAGASEVNFDTGGLLSVINLLSGNSNLEFSLGGLLSVLAPIGSGQSSLSFSLSGNIYFSLAQFLSSSGTSPVEFETSTENLPYIYLDTNTIYDNQIYTETDQLTNEEVP